MTKRVTAFTCHPTAEGERCAFTYSEIDDTGVIKTQNKRAEIILMDSEMIQAAQQIYNFLQNKIPD